MYILHVPQTFYHWGCHATYIDVYGLALVGVSTSLALCLLLSPFICLAGLVAVLPLSAFVFLLFLLVILVFATLALHFLKLSPCLHVSAHPHLTLVLSLVISLLLPFLLLASFGTGQRIWVLIHLSPRFSPCLCLSACPWVGWDLGFWLFCVCCLNYLALYCHLFTYGYLPLGSSWCLC